MATQRKSEATHWLQGTEPEYATDKPSVDRAARPKMPPGLSPVAQDAFKRICRVLRERGTLTKADSELITLYAVNFAAWVKITADLEREGYTSEVVWTDGQGENHSKIVESPLSKIAMRQAAQLRQLLVQLGATPAAREKTRPARRVPPREFEPGSVGYILAQKPDQETEEKDEQKTIVI